MFVLKPLNTPPRTFTLYIPMFGGTLAEASLCIRLTKSLGVIVWQCLTGLLPFEKSSKEAEVNESRESISCLLSQGQLPWLSNKMDEAAWGGVIPVILSCWRSQPSLRPPPAFVAQRLLDILTEGCILPNFSVRPSLSADSQKIERISGECWAIIQKVRKSKGIREDRDKLAGNEFHFLLRSSREAFDPVISFLVGAAIWWEVSDFKEWDDDLSEAHDMKPDGMSPLLPV